MSGSRSWLGLDKDNQCKFCNEFDLQKSGFGPHPDGPDAYLQSIADEARRRRAPGSRYDAIVGISGGVDSSYLMLLAKEYDLNILAVHFDNGWNSKASVQNIANVIDHCGYHLETLVADWPSFRDMQRAHIKAGVIDIEMVTDHAMVASLLHLAKKNRIRTILNGYNFATEHGLPPEWVWYKFDWRNMKDIHRKHGEQRLRNFPHLRPLRYEVTQAFGIGVRALFPLQRIGYNKDTAMERLQADTGWQPYGAKHYESVFTRFYQAYILPRKFSVDKRLVHQSALVRSGFVKRADALMEVKSPLYEARDLARDHRFVCKKLGFSEVEFEAIMDQEPVPHDAYATSKPMMDFVKKTGSPIRRALRPDR